MGIKEIVLREQTNTKRIFLYKEGIFFRAYERSAFALCSQGNNFKVSSQVVKSCGNKEILHIGFPSSSEDKYMSGFKLLSSDSSFREYECSEFSESSFKEWKMSKCGIESSILNFKLSEHTPEECVMFLYDLQMKILSR